MLRRLDALQRRRRLLGFVIAVVYKFIDDQGGYLAALIAYYAFVSLFPMLLLLATVLGFVLAGHPDLQQSLISSAVGEFPVIGKQLGDPRGLGGGVAGVLIGLFGAIYGASGVGQATQNAMNIVWAVPRNDRPNPFSSRVRSLYLLLVLALILAGTSTLSFIGDIVNGFPVITTTALRIAAVVINTVVFSIGYRVGTAREVSWRDVVPGAFLMALLWLGLQTFGSLYVGRIVRTASATNSVFAVVLGLLAFLYLTAVAIVITSEINAVRVRKLHPRALLTPFTDDVTLAAGDRRTYTFQAQAQRAKGFERIDVHFDDRDND